MFSIRNRQFQAFKTSSNHPKHLRYFDVGCFPSEIVSFKHPKHLQIIQNTCDISTLDVFHPKSSVSSIQIIQNTCDISTLDVFHPKSSVSSIQNIFKSSKTLAIFRRW